MTVALYARVSTRDKEQNPEMQLAALRKYADAMGWPVYREYVDRVSAGALVDRQGWTALIKDASTHQFDILLIWKLDRAFRSVQHASNTIQQLNGYHVGFRSYMDPSIDTTTPNGMLVFNILSSVAQFEKDLLVQRVNAGIEYAKEHGTKSGKPIGRARVQIEDCEILELGQQLDGNRSAIARELSERYNREVSAGFVSLRLKRMGK